MISSQLCRKKYRWIKLRTPSSWRSPGKVLWTLSISMRPRRKPRFLTKSNTWSKSINHPAKKQDRAGAMSPFRAYSVSPKAPDVTMCAAGFIGLEYFQYKGVTAEYKQLYSQEWCKTLMRLVPSAESKNFDSLHYKMAHNIEYPTTG